MHKVDYTLTITLKDYPNIDDELIALMNFYNEYLQNNGSIVIIDTACAHNYEFISRPYNYKTIKHAYDIITAYDQGLTVVNILENI